MGRISFLAYSFATLSLLSVAACDGDSSESAQFSESTMEEKQRALSAAIGADASMGMLLATFLEATPPGAGCPRVTRSGDTLTASTDCTDEDGNRHAGRIIAKNLPSLFGEGTYDPSRPTDLSFEAYSVEGGNPSQVVALDGSVIFRPDGSQTTDLTSNLGGILVTIDATLRTLPNGNITADAGSSIEVDGLGRAEIAGSWNADEEEPAGAIELRGADTLSANFAAMSNGCVPLTINGAAAGQICDD